MNLTKEAIDEIEAAVSKGMVCEVSQVALGLRLCSHPPNTVISLPYPVTVKAGGVIVLSIAKMTPDGFQRADLLQAYLSKEYIVTGINGQEVGEP